MRVAVIVEPGPVQPPMDQLPGMLQAFVMWRDKWRDKMELFQFWAGRPGGLGIVDVADERELSQMMFEYPLGPYSTLDTRLVVDGDEALQRLVQTVNEMLQMAAGQQAT